MKKKMLQSILLAIIILLGCLFYSVGGKTNIQESYPSNDEHLSLQPSEDLSASSWNLDIGQLGQVKLVITTHESYPSMSIKVLDHHMALLYGVEINEGLGIEIASVTVADVNTDGYEDVVIIFSSYHGAGYLGGLKYSKALVLLQENKELVLDHVHYEDGNEYHIDTSFNNVVFYYQSHNFTEDLYQVSNTKESFDGEFLTLTVNRPSIISNDSDFSKHTNDIIDYHILSLVNPINQVDTKTSVTVDYEVVRNDRWLSVVFCMDYYQMNTAHPILTMSSLTIDLAKGTTLHRQDISSLFSQPAEEIISLCDSVSYAGYEETEVPNGIKALIKDNQYVGSTYLGRDHLCLYINTNSASGSFIKLYFPFDKISDYLLIPELLSGQ